VLTPFALDELLFVKPSLIVVLISFWVTLWLRKFYVLKLFADEFLYFSFYGISFVDILSYASST
jgi:hypothetical protein